MKYISIFSIVMVITFFAACTKDTMLSTDEDLYNKAKETSGFVYYKNSSSALVKSTGSAHSQPFLKTRFNSLAAKALDANYKVQGTFPESSVIVKELIGANNNIEAYAILYKKSSHGDADDNGWVWGYLNADGSVIKPASDKGVGCISCHSQSGNIDMTLMNKFFP